MGLQLPFQCNDLILARTGTQCQGRYIPKDLPPRSTLFGYFGLWNWGGTLDGIHHALYVKCGALDREASPTACVIDSQSS